MEGVGEKGGDKVANNCINCGKSFGGLVGVKRVCKSTVEDFETYGIDTTDICMKCCKKLKEELLQKNQNEINQTKKNIENAKENVIKKISIFTTPHDHKYDKDMKGIVSGYSVLGTGMISEIASSWTDFFGKESDTYQEKIKIAEKHAIDMAKLQAAELGATCISGVNLSLSEATHGNGMLMFSCVGTAVRIEGFDQPVNYYHIQKEKLEELKRKPFITVADTEDSYEKMKSIQEVVSENS